MGEELKFGARKVIRVLIDETSYDVKKPTNGDFLEYQKQFKSAESDEAKQELMISFLERLGLPRAAFLMLDTDETEQLTKALFPQKKTS